MKPLNRISIAIYTLVLMAGLGVAHAGQVTVSYQTFPPITLLDNNVVNGCDNATAENFSGYQFEFWDNQAVPQVAAM